MTFSGRYSLDKVGWIGGVWGKPKFEFQNNPETPLTCDDGDLLVRPDNHFFTDKGSVPRLLQTILPIWFDRSRFERSYLYHDSGYLHGGHWISSNRQDWHFVPLTRKQVDRYLFDMVRAEGGSKGAARAIYAGVRAGGWISWKRKIKTAYQADIKPEA